MDPFKKKAKDFIGDKYMMMFYQLHCSMDQFSSDSDRFFRILLSRVEVAMLKTFGTLLLCLASADPTHLLREHSETVAIAVMPDEQIKLFWHLLRCQAAGNEDAIHAFSLFRPFFFRQKSRRLSKLINSGCCSSLSLGR